MMNNIKTTRFTTTLPTSFIEELKILVKSHQIPSVNFGIRQAIDDYLVQARKSQYAEMMKEASKDEAFISRTAKCSNDFVFADNEVQGEW